mmetsp:Transcript_117851/g.345271  ORF Transcript_117851/g.345271 Transcript_117851/m.345271 type:complete len:236 (-) Transcript_117851:730-1437(-)
MRRVWRPEGVDGHAEEEPALAAHVLLVRPPVHHAGAGQDALGLVHPDVRPVRFRRPLELPLRVRQQEPRALHHQQPQPFRHRRRDLPGRGLGEVRVRAGHAEAVHLPHAASHRWAEARECDCRSQGARAHRRLGRRPLPQDQGDGRHVAGGRPPAYPLCRPRGDARGQLLELLHRRGLVRRVASRQALGELPPGVLQAPGHGRAGHASPEQGHPGRGPAGAPVRRQVRHERRDGR